MRGKICELLGTGHHPLDPQKRLGRTVQSFGLLFGAQGHLLEAVLDQVDGSVGVEGKDVGSRE